MGFLSVSLLGSKSSVSPLLQPWPLLIRYGITLFLKLNIPFIIAYDIVPIMIPYYYETSFPTNSLSMSSLLVLANHTI